MTLEDELAQLRATNAALQADDLVRT